MADKKCDYCPHVGEAFTFADGETLCRECFKSLPIDANTCRKEIVKLRREVAEAQNRLKRINERIYAEGAPLGSDAYFFIREQCCSNTEEKHAEQPNVQQQAASAAPIGVIAELTFAERDPVRAVEWANGRLPPVGTKLYATPTVPAQQQAASEKPFAYWFDDRAGRHFTEERQHIDETPEIEEWGALYSRPTVPADVMADALRQHADWCDAQARSDWYGRTAGDMARTHAEQVAARAAEKGMPL